MHKEVLIYYCLMDKNLLTCACACLDAVNDNVTGSLGEMQSMQEIKALV